jgi:hypothetical protein
MTIAASVWVPEGIVFASESRQVYENEKHSYRIASDNAQKVFDLSSRTGGVTYGRAFIDKKSIISLIEEFKASAKAARKDLDQTPLQEIVNSLGSFLDKVWHGQTTERSGEESPELGLIIGGYEGGTSRIFECSIPGPSIIEIGTSQKPGAAWRGQTDVVTRLILGFDPRINKLSWFLPNHVDELEKLNYVIRFDAMTLQDAIDFAIFLIRTTIDMQRFSDGIVLDPGDIPGTGGSIDISIVRPNEGFSWVQKKELKGETPFRQERVS